ncbi:MAG: hypothetical protein ACYCZV_16765, partial [Acidimicrobiales bacterium]
PADAAPADVASAAARSGADGAPEPAPADTPAPAAAGTPPPGAEGNSDGPSTGPRTIYSAPVEPVDLLEAAGGSVTKRLVPVGLGLMVLIILWRVLRRG